MKIVFGMLREPSGRVLYSEFRASIERETDRLEFAIGPLREGENIGRILKRIADIDTRRTVYLNGMGTLQVEQVDVRLDMTVTFYQEALLTWTIVVPSWPALLNSEQRRLLQRVQVILEDRVRVMRPIIVGTARAIFVELKETAQDEVRQDALRSARMMRANAEAIITFLKAPFDFWHE